MLTVQEVGVEVRAHPVLVMPGCEVHGHDLVEAAIDWRSAFLGLGITVDDHVEHLDVYQLPLLKLLRYCER